MRGRSPRAGADLSPPSPRGRPQALLVCPSRHLHATRLQTLQYFMMHDPLNAADYDRRAETDLAVLRDVLRRANTTATSRFTEAVVRAH